MVFCHIRAFSWSKRKSAVNVVRTVLLQHLQSGIVSPGIYRRWKYPEIEDSLSSFSGTGRFMAGTFLGNEKHYCASFTVEAMLVLSIVFFTVALIIQNAYVIHDRVTGTMILEETVERIRYSREERAEEITREGKERGNPRLWLGHYEIQMKEDTKKARGKATAGKWSKEIEMKKFKPEQLIRKYRALMEIGEWAEKDGS